MLDFELYKIIISPFFFRSLSKGSLFRWQISSKELLFGFSAKHTFKIIFKVCSLLTKVSVLSNERLRFSSKYKYKMTIRDSFQKFINAEIWKFKSSLITILGNYNSINFIFLKNQLHCFFFRWLLSTEKMTFQQQTDLASFIALRTWPDLGTLWLWWVFTGSPSVFPFPSHQSFLMFFTLCLVYDRQEAFRSTTWKIRIFSFSVDLWSPFLSKHLSFIGQLLTKFEKISHY